MSHAGTLWLCTLLDLVPLIAAPSPFQHVHYTPAALPAQLPLLDKAADRLLNGEAYEQLREEMTVFRADNAWVEQSALFRWVPPCSAHAATFRCACVVCWACLPTCYLLNVSR
jgi:hypothetical protein